MLGDGVSQAGSELVKRGVDHERLDIIARMINDVAEAHDVTVVRERSLKILEHQLREVNEQHKKVMESGDSGWEQQIVSQRRFMEVIRYSLLLLFLSISYSDFFDALCPPPFCPLSPASTLSASSTSSSFLVV
mmetsp:Transcript_21207/g.47818  ORF Transcript_21207/g.47818 Transcript_21207/m.47818 type:complete len:133 (+) Transcript_21207:1666-2064(+)